MEDNRTLLTQVFTYVEPTSIRQILSVKNMVEELGSKEGMYLWVQLLNVDQEMLSNNFYWLPDSVGKYSGLQYIEKVKITAKDKRVSS